MTDVETRICEIVEDQQNGLLVRYGDVDSLSAALVRLIRNAALRHQLVENGWRKAKQQYTCDLYQKRLLEVVGEVFDAGLTSMVCSRSLATVGVPKQITA